MPEISVLLAVYNTEEKYLRECVESILNQTFGNFELIILNDGSVNNVEEVIKSYSDVRIRYYKNSECEGITKTRNKLLNLARGKYIAIHDHDDISLPERFEKEYNFLESHPEISIVSGWIEVFSQHSGHKKNKVWKTKTSPKYFDFLKRCELIHPACMWRTADFQKFGLIYEDGYLGAQDYAMFAKAIRYLKFANLQEVLLKYRRHCANVSRNTAAMKQETKKVKDEMINFLTSEIKEQKILYSVFSKTKTSFLQKLRSVFYLLF